MEKIRLTQYSHGSGCGCKIAPADLEKILSNQQTAVSSPLLLVGNQSNDDAAVWDLQNGEVLISTVDFFLPVVDDAFDFGRIAAANALSDIYAMGGRPVFANALLGWPMEKLPAELATEVLNGARSVCDPLGVIIAGGHSINSNDPIFGLAVNGLAKRAAIKKNNTAKTGDFLYLTKPLGLGIMSTAIKRGIAAEDDKQTAINLMCEVNTIGETFGAITGVNAMTDVTGFGLLGHLLEMAEGSGLTAAIQMSKIPMLPFLATYLKQNAIPDNTYRNWNAWEKKVKGVSDMTAFQVLNDPQTSGGLLVAVDPNTRIEVEAALKEHKIEVCCIGQMMSKTDYSIEVST